jgi:hypothetical protein
MSPYPSQIRPLALVMFFLSFTAVGAIAQQFIRGKVLGAPDKQALAAASVFLSNTSTGVVSKADGSFVLGPVGNGRYDLVVSLLGYETAKQEIMVGVNGVVAEIIVLLQPKATVLQEVIVQSYDKDGWKEWGDFFLENLIGKTPNADQCKLRNTDAVKIKYSKTARILRAFAEEPLVIENQALGYTLQYELSQFEYNFKTGVFYYQGYPLFVPMVATKPAQQRRWERNRQEAYEGSLMHFLRAVFRNKIAEEGFQVRRIIRQRSNAPGQSLFKLMQPGAQTGDILVNQLLTGDSIAFAIDSTTAGFQFKDYLQITYPNKKMSIRYTQSVLRSNSTLPMTAELWMPDPSAVIAIFENGSFFYGKDLLNMAYWSWSEKLSNLLPLDYRPPVRN